MAVDGGKYGYGRRRLRDVERRGDGSATYISVGQLHLGPIGFKLKSNI